MCCNYHWVYGFSSHLCRAAFSGGLDVVGLAAEEQRCADHVPTGEPLLLSPLRSMFLWSYFIISMIPLSNWLASLGECELGTKFLKRNSSCSSCSAK